MAIGPYVTGPAIIKVNLRDGNGLVTLGYSADGVQISERILYNDIHSDRYGGQAGPPIDRQFMGRMARIPVQLVEFNSDIFNLIRNFQFGTPAGISDVGTPLTADGKSIQVVISGQKDLATLSAAPATKTLSPLNYPNCFIDDPLDIPIGAKNSIIGLEFTATQFTSDTTQGGDGLTFLNLTQSEEEINNLAAYDNTP